MKTENIEETEPPAMINTQTDALDSSISQPYLLLPKIGLLFSILTLIVSSKKELAVAGCVLCGVAIFLGAIRLVLGFGIF